MNLPHLLFLCLLAIDLNSAKNCDEAKCRGPVKFYEELRCKPVYENPDDCCAVRYNCSNLNGRSEEKCYAFGRVFAVGEYLTVEEPCERYLCEKDSYHPADFRYAPMDCEKFDTEYHRPKDIYDYTKDEDCFNRRNQKTRCCTELVCQKKDERFKCEVNNKTYVEGDKFYPESNLECYCHKDYKGENIAPFCKNDTSCDLEILYGSAIRQKWIPVFRNESSIVTGCPMTHLVERDFNRQPDVFDVQPANISSELFCTYFNGTLSVGKEVYYRRDYSSCARCKCEVPPVPSCVDVNSELCS